ncbi:MAG: hypothetical protein HOP28_01340 [Gemmatimonadales bacterium]|nr:hypothetical protein [Gemmatimonadales bacterium]
MPIRWRFLLCALIAIAPPAAGQVSGNRGRIVVTPRGPVILGEEVTIRLDGLLPGIEYQLVAETVNEWGALFQSVNTFVAGTSGVIELSQDAPVRGSYTRADRLGIFWSAVRQGTPPSVGPTDAPADSIQVSLVLRQEGRTVDSTRLVQWLLRPGATVRELREGGIVGALYQPAGAGPRPLVVLLGGSGGGMTWQRQAAAVLASHGYLALALAYFGVPGLPPALSDIPLEYFREAIALSKRHADVDPTHVAMIGLSRGAEAALLAATKFPEISAVVAFAPSHVVFMGQLPPRFPLQAAWTFGGNPVPYVPTREIRPFRRTDNEAERTLRYLVVNAEAAAASVIPVERIQGPILLFSGGTDPIWPSGLMAELITERLAAKGFKQPFQRFSYDSAGHAFARPGYVSTTPAGFTGGDPRANAYAQVESWRRMLEFLAAWR